MSEHEWKPGDVAMVPGIGRALVVNSGKARVVSNLGDRDLNQFVDVYPLVVIDPEDREQVEQLLDSFIDVAAGGHLDALQAALRALANPAPEPMPEPTDPAVRVVDAEGCVMARIGDEWVSSRWGPICWEQAWHERGPLRIVTPDAPTPDADRPLQVGDWVRVADDGRNADGNKLGCMAGREGRVADRTYFVDTPTGGRVEMVMIDIEAGPDANRGAARVCDVTRIPGGEA